LSGSETGVVSTRTARKNARSPDSAAKPDTSAPRHGRCRIALPYAASTSPSIGRSVSTWPGPSPRAPATPARV